MLTKVCSDCKVEKTLEFFHKKVGRKFGVDGVCKECKKIKRPSRKGCKQSSEYWQKYYSDNKERLNQRYWTDPKVREYQLSRYHSNPGKFLEQGSTYRKNNLEKFAAKEAARRARKLCATPLWLTEQQKDEINRFYWLAQDLRIVSGNSYHVDHIVPLKGRNVCGLHVPWNLQILPSDINTSKNNRFEDI